jgi:hypothetical protein
MITIADISNIYDDSYGAGNADGSFLGMIVITLR